MRRQGKITAAAIAAAAACVLLDPVLRMDAFVSESLLHRGRRVCKPRWRDVRMVGYRSRLFPKHFSRGW